VYTLAHTLCVCIITHILYIWNTHHTHEVYYHTQCIHDNNMCVLFMCVHYHTHYVCTLSLTYCIHEIHITHMRFIITHNAYMIRTCILCTCVHYHTHYVCTYYTHHTHCVCTYHPHVYIKIHITQMRCIITHTMYTWS